jgi:hypothetical protein
MTPREVLEIFNFFNLLRPIQDTHEMKTHDNSCLQPDDAEYCLTVKV